MVNFSGLTEPITKLIQVVAAGIGQVYEPHRIKRLADAKANQIEKIAAAISEHQGTGAKIEYKSEDVIITQTNVDEPKQDEEHSLANRALSRFAYQEAKKQINIEQIVRQTAEQLRLEQQVSEQPVDQDWITRFFDIAEHVSTEEMQTLWSRVLAGEVKSPGTYSLRTLDILRNISKEEAETFTKLANLTIIFGGKATFIDFEDHQQLYKDYGISFFDLVMLKEVGLITPEDLSLMLDKLLSPTSFFYGTKVVVISKKEENTPINGSLSMKFFTKAGEELLSIINVDANENYLQRLSSVIAEKGGIVQILDKS